MAGMSRRISIAPNEYYHLYNRGTEKRKIFLNDNDYRRFMAMLYLCNTSASVHMAELFPRGSTSWNFERMLAFERGESLIDIGAYCLMPNHFHLLVKEKTEGGISRFMQKLVTGYTMYFNTLNDRSGALLQGKYKAGHADNDQYLKYLISYIHLNPVKLIEPRWKEAGIANRKRAEKYLQEYAYSSFVDYCGTKRTENAILNRASLPEYFETPKIFKQSVEEWLGYSKDSAASTRSNLV